MWRAAGDGAAMSLPDAASCHHCHIHAPIPAEALKRTHPLRSGSPAGGGLGGGGGGLSSSFRKNVSFLYRKINGGTLSIPPPPPPPPPQPSARATNSSLAHSHCSLPPSVSRSSPGSSLQSSPRQVTSLPPALIIDSQPPEPPPHRKPLPPIPREGKKRRGFTGLQGVLLVGAYALLVRVYVVLLCSSPS